jgi:hypothetical protein
LCFLPALCSTITRLHALKQYSGHHIAVEKEGHCSWPSTPSLLQQVAGFWFAPTNGCASAAEAEDDNAAHYTDAELNDVAAVVVAREHGCDSAY